MNPRVKRALAAASAMAALSMALTAGACDSSSSSANGNNIINGEQANQDTQYAYVQPLPYFPFSQIRQTLIEIEAINALGIASTAFFFVPGINHPILVCPAIGVPVPSTDELSNPVVAQWNSGGTSGEAGVGVGQEDPDGVFKGDTTGTGSLCVNNAGNQYLGVNEGYTVAVTAPAYWDNVTGMIHITGTPVMPVCKVKVLDAAKKKAEEVCTDPSKTR